MALAFVWKFQNLWPFSAFKFDDLKESDKLVQKLPIPEHTKQFVYAVREPETQSVIYILTAQNLSELSARDAEHLIREVRPGAVVAQVGQSAEAQFGGDDDDGGNYVPTSYFGVLRRCFVERINKEKYEHLAGNLVLREIFGIDFHGHFISARKAAEEAGSLFLLIESPFVKSSVEDDDPSGELGMGNYLQGLVSSLVSPKLDLVVSSSSRRFFLADERQLKMVKLLSSSMDLSMSSSVAEVRSREIQPRSDFEAPPFAKSIYPLLTDLHDIFGDLPSIDKALAYAQKMLIDVNKGKSVDAQIMSEVYTFRVAVEGLRIALNNAGRLPIHKIVNSNSAKSEFSDLSIEEKSHVLFAQALRDQAKKFKSVVAVVDASGLAGLRKHWNTTVPLEIKNLVGELIPSHVEDGENLDHPEKKRSLSKNPVLAVGAGATAVLGASAVSKAVPASTIMKVVTFKIPASLKLMLTQTHKAVTIVLGKTLGPSKLVPGLASSGAKTSSVLKATASAEKIRAVTHSVIASMEKTSFSAMRAAFYEIMRKRQARPVSYLPWATFGCSMATCAGLFAYGDGIECVMESVPSAPSIASLGRGIQSLHQASQELSLTEGSRIQKSIESLMYKWKNRSVK